MPLRESIIPDFQFALVYLKGGPRSGKCLISPNWPSPYLWNKPEDAGSRLIQRFELLIGLLEFRIALMNDFQRSALERLFSGDARNPALFGKLFV
jgi:hypothetical protein